MTACRLKDQESPYTLVVAHHVIGFYGDVSCTCQMRSKRGEPIGGGAICQCYQETYGSTCGSLMHANSIQNENLDGWNVFW